MSDRILDNVILERESCSYIDCLHSVLAPARLFKGPKFLLSGMTGAAFPFIVNKSLLPISTEISILKGGCGKSLDMLGIYSEVFSGNNYNPAFGLYQDKAVERVKESINRGMGSIFWEPEILEFGVIYGYDDADNVFYYKDRVYGSCQVMLYENLGKSHEPYWMCQIIGEGVYKDIRDIYMESLEDCIYKWERPFSAEGYKDRDFFSGYKAYEHLIKVLDKGSFCEDGMVRIIKNAAISRSEILRYIKEMRIEFPKMAGAVSIYEKLNELYKDISGMTEEGRMYRIIISRMIELLKQARDLELLFVDNIKNFVAGEGNGSL